MHPEVKSLLKDKSAKDTAFAKNASDQLEFVYRHSPYVEPRHNIYPIYRIVNSQTAESLKPIFNNEAEIKNKEDE